MYRRALAIVGSMAAAGLALTLPASANAPKDNATTWTVFDATTNTAIDESVVPANNAFQRRSATALPYLPSSVGTGSISDAGPNARTVQVTPRGIAATPTDDQFLAPFSVIGTDNRTQLSPAAHSSSPYKQIVLIEATSPSGSTGYCTGFLYGANDIATAGHCISPSAGQVNSNWTVYFIHIGAGYYEMSCGASYYAVPNLYLNDRNWQYDYGWLQLNCNAGATYGNIGLLNNAAPGSNLWTISGYPGPGSAPTDYFQYQHVGKVSNPSSRLLTYSIDTTGGQSGSPIFRLQSGGCGYCAIGIHTNGTGTGTPGGSLNSGRHIGTGTFNDLTYWKNWG